MNRKNPSFAHAKEGWLDSNKKQIQFNPSVPVLWIKADIRLVVFMVIQWSGAVLKDTAHLNYYRICLEKMPSFNRFQFVYLLSEYSESLFGHLLTSELHLL